MNSMISWTAKTACLLLAGFLLTGTQSIASSVSAPTALPIVTDTVSDGTRVLVVIFPGRGKSMEFTKVGAKHPFKKQSFDSSDLLTSEQNFDESGLLQSEFSHESGSRSWREYSKGLLAREKQETADGKFVETEYRNDGKSVRLVKTSTADGAAPSYKYVAADGTYLLRSFEGSRMTVLVCKKDGEPLYLQIWQQDGAYYRLAEVQIGSGRERRLVYMKADGITVDHVDYQISGFVGWSTLKSEEGNKLSEPLESRFLQELNSDDDPSAPALAPPFSAPDTKPASDPDSADKQQG